MPAIQLTVTTAGLDALVDAQNGDTDPIVIAELGLASASFTAAPTLEGLPHEFKRIDAIAGTSASETVIHMVAQDSSTDVYSVYGIGLFLADGTLFAAYAQEEPIVNKVSIASFLIAFDIAFLDAVDVAIEFGDASFVYPPATETVKGVAEIATDAEADAGVDDQRIMTPKKVKRVLDALAAVLTAAQAAFEATITAAQTAFETAVNASIAALQARTITGGGLVSGGGDLTANRVLTVAAAGADVTNPAIATKAVTPQDLWSFTGSDGLSDVMQIPGTKYILMFATATVSPNSTLTVSLPATFPGLCKLAFVNGSRADFASQDNPPFISAVTNSSVTIYNPLDGGSVPVQILAIGF